MSQFLPGSMHKILPAGEFGAAKVVHDRPDALTKLRAAMHGQPLDCEVYTRLIVGGTLWMTDADYEWRTNLEPVRNMTGDVLIAGLGIGFVLAPLRNRERITSVTVIEKNADVIALVEPTFPFARVIHADIYEWEPPKKSFDCIYFDIWENVPNRDDWEDMKTLKKRYRPALRKGGWIGAWCEDRAKQ